jgi:hypothetical protein
VLGNSENFAGTNALRRMKKTPGMGSSMSNVLAGSGGAVSGGAGASAASGGAFAAALSSAPDTAGTVSEPAPVPAAADAGGDTVSL